MNSDLIPPVLCIGATRSGTSMLVRLLGELPGCMCWYEPNALWRTGHAYRAHDAATEKDAKSWVRSWIRERFLEQQWKAGGARVVEKSPYNVLRIRFVHEIFPEAKILHIYRDGRANLRSQMEQFDTFQAWSDDTPKGHLRRRLREIPFWEWPAYAPRSFSGIARARLTKKPVSWFGLRYPGWQRDRRRLNPAELAAWQWRIAVETALDDLQAINSDSWINIRYEDLVSNPDVGFREIANFAGLRLTARFWSLVHKRVHKDSISRWRQEIEPSDLTRARPILAPTLQRLGYDLRDLKP